MAMRAITKPLLGDDGQPIEIYARQKRSVKGVKRTPEQKAAWDKREAALLQRRAALMARLAENPPPPPRPKRLREVPEVAPGTWEAFLKD